MNTQTKQSDNQHHSPSMTTHDHRIHTLERAANRWKLAAVSSSALLIGMFIGGMGAQSNSRQSQNNNANDQIVGVAGVGDRIFRVHQDGSLSAIRIVNGERSIHGYYNWGEVKIDPNRTNRTIPQP